MCKGKSNIINYINPDLRLPIKGNKALRVLYWSFEHTYYKCPRWIFSFSLESVKHHGHDINSYWDEREKTSQTCKKLRSCSQTFLRENGKRSAKGVGCKSHIEKILSRIGRRNKRGTNWGADKTIKSCWIKSWASFGCS